MPIEYLTYLNIVLLSRLIYLVRDRSLTLPGNALLAAIQCALCALCALCAAVFKWSVALWAMLFCVVIFTGLGWFIERHIQNIANWRLISLAGLVLIPGIYFSAPDNYAFSSLYTSLLVVVSSSVPLLSADILDGRIALLLFGCLIVANEANIVMRVILHYCNLEPRKQRQSGDMDGSQRPGALQQVR